MTITTGALNRAHAHAIQFLNELDTNPVGATVNAAGLRSKLAHALPETGTNAEIVIDDLVDATRGGHLGSASGRFFAWVIGGALPSALAADWLTSTWDNNATLFACGPAASVIEETAGEWVKSLLGLPLEASFAFTTGCQMAHFTCLAAARYALLATRGWNVEAKGLFGAPPIRVLTTEHRHGSIERAVRYLGIGSSNVLPLETDADGRLRAPTLAAALAMSSQPTMVVLDAADLNIGAIDPFTELIPLARASNAWVHVDGAFGLWARVSARFADNVARIERADSWATDAHKWLNTPKDNGIAIIRHSDAHRASVQISADYLSSPGGVRDQIDWTPDWTRRARGFAVYAAIRELGRAGIADLIDRCCDHARHLVLGLAALPGGEAVAVPTLNQGLVHFRSPGFDASPEADDRWTERIIAALNREGTAFFSGSLWRGRRVMRVSVVNWRTNRMDVERTLTAAARVIDRERGLWSNELHIGSGI